MATRRRASRKSLTANISEIQRRLRYLETKPNPSRLSNQVVNRNAIQFNAVATDQIAPDAVTSTQIATDAVTNDQIAPDAVTNENLADGAVGEANVQNGSISTDKIEDGAVTTAKLAKPSVGRNELGDGAVYNEKIQSGAVSTGKIQDLAITTEKLAASAVTTSKIGNLQVTEGKIATGAVTSGKLGTDSVIIGKMAVSVVRWREISPSAVGTSPFQVASGLHSHPVNGSTSRNLNHSHSISGTASSRKFKKEIENYELSEEDKQNILNLQLSKFKYRNEMRDSSLNREWNYGYLAEDVADTALEQIVEYNAKGEPVAIDYGLLSAFVLELVKEQAQEIESLKNRISDLEGTK